MYCKRCGKELDGSYEYCPNCGQKVDDTIIDNDTGEVRSSTVYNSQPVSEKKASNWWFVLGFIQPFAGLILWLVIKNDRPNVAKKAGKGAIWGAVVTIILMIVYFILLYYFISNSTGPVDPNIPGGEIIF